MTDIDLNRMYVVSGDELARALAGATWTLRSSSICDVEDDSGGVLKHSETVARTALEEAGARHVIAWTVADGRAEVPPRIPHDHALISALSGTWQFRSTGDGSLRTGQLTSLGAVAVSVSDRLQRYYGDDPAPGNPMGMGAHDPGGDEEKGDPNGDEVAAFAAAWKAIAGLDVGAAERVVIHVAGMLGADVQF